METPWEWRHAYSWSCEVSGSSLHPGGEIWNHWVASWIAHLGGPMFKPRWSCHGLFWRWRHPGKWRHPCSWSCEGNGPYQPPDGAILYYWVGSWIISFFYCSPSGVQVVSPSRRWYRPPVAGIALPCCRQLNLSLRQLSLTLTSLFGKACHEQDSNPCIPHVWDF